MIQDGMTPGCGFQTSHNCRSVLHLPAASVCGLAIKCLICHKFKIAFGNEETKLSIHHTGTKDPVTVNIVNASCTLLKHHIHSCLFPRRSASDILEGTQKSLSSSMHPLRMPLARDVSSNFTSLSTPSFCTFPRVFNGNLESVTPVWKQSKPHKHLIKTSAFAGLHFDFFEEG